MRVIGLTKHVTIETTTNELGTILAAGSADEQARWLVAWAEAAKAFNWPMQCRSIVDGMDDEDRMAVVMMLGTLIEHLTESRELASGS